MSNTTIKNQRTSRINRIKAVRNIPASVLLKKKAECDAKALKIVEQLIEPNVQVEWLLQNLRQINRTHLEDVAEERAIIKLCGYVLCNNPLTKIINKKYQISTLKNKVYDIEKTKNFCSYPCYVAMNHLMVQLLTSPLWLRNEEEILEFTILPQCEQNTKYLPGVEVNIMGIELPDDNCNIEAEDTKVKNERIKDAKGENIETKDLELKENTIKLTQMEKHQAQEEKYNQNPFNSKPIEDQWKLQKTSQSSRDTSKVVEISQKIIPEKKHRIKAKPAVSFESLTMRIEQSFTEWITRDTINLLHGEKSDKQQIIDNITQQENYMTLCRKLNRIQLEEEKEDRSLTIQVDNLKPAPHFSVLEEEADKLELKVRAYYEGKMDTVISEKKSKNPDLIQETENIVPLTEAHDPRALRRRIFLDKLNKVLPDLLHALVGPEYGLCAYEADKVIKVKTLINTFDLSATNIVFRTAEWTLVGLIIIKLLGVIDPMIKSLLLTKKAAMYISMILEVYKLDSIYLDHLIDSQTLPLKINC